MNLYHRTYAAAAIIRDGFRDGDGPPGVRRGVWVYDEPLDEQEGALGNVALVISGVPEAVVANFEWRLCNDNCDDRPATISMTGRMTGGSLRVQLRSCGVCSSRCHRRAASRARGVRPHYNEPSSSSTAAVPQPGCDPINPGLIKALGLI